MRGYFSGVAARLGVGGAFSVHGSLYMGRWVGRAVSGAVRALKRVSSRAGCCCGHLEDKSVRATREGWFGFVRLSARCWFLIWGQLGAFERKTL